MPHAEQCIASKYIQQGSAEIIHGPVMPFHTAEAVKTNPRQIHAQGEHGVTKSRQILLRNKDRRKAERISNHVVLECREQIRAEPDVQVIGRK